jgi:pyruvate kinase
MRPDVPVLALCPDCRAARQLAFYYGVLSVCVPRSKDIGDWLTQAETLCIDNGLAQKGDSILLLPPEKLLAPQHRWSITLHTIAE